MRDQIIGVFHEDKPIVVNSEVGKIWTIEVVLDSEVNERLTLSQIKIQPSSSHEMVQRYVVSVEE
jgi:hypothetical protein